MPRTATAAMIQYVCVTDEDRTSQASSPAAIPTPYRM
jgi:hypothetical protein